MKEHKFGTRHVAVRRKSSRTAHEAQSVLNDFLGELIVDEAGLTPCTVSAVRGVEERRSCADFVQKKNSVSLFRYCYGNCRM